MDLSIVVPIYNVESYLEACLSSIESILSNENVELILVNDGSKDGSEDICYKYIDKTTNNKQQTTNNKQQTTNNKQQTTNNTRYRTPNIKYIYQDNQGLSEARNTGIKNSNGKYIAFIDSDDFINCQVLLDFLGKDDSDMPDVVFLNAVKYD